MRQKLNLITLLLFLVGFYSCQKEARTLVLQNKIDNQQLPTIRIDKYFLNGVLEFKTKESFKAFYEKVEQNPDYVKQVLPNFKSFQTSLDSFETKQSFSVKDKHATPKTQGIIAATVVGRDEYLMDMRQEALPVETLQPIVNDDLDVIIENQLYQFTRIGLFQVNMNAIDNYIELFEDNLNNIYYNPDFVSIPNERAIGNNQYQISTGIVRNEVSIGDDVLDVNNITYLPEPGGGFQDPGGSSGRSPGSNLVPDYYVNYVKPDFNQDNLAIVFNDWAKRRLVFKTRNINLFGIYHRIGMKAKVQREKKFLWITYWGSSYAEELIIGFDNMNMSTSYVFPHPYQVTMPNRPEFAGLADFKLGNYLLKDVLHVNINLSALNYSLSNNEVASFIDGRFNSVVGKTYNNLYKQMETKILNRIDNNFSARWDGYKKSMEMLDDQYKLKVALGKAEKPQGYSHSNDWVFDWNIEVSFKINGGVAGGYPASYGYSYEMKSGSFYTRARVGNVWHGIRVIIKK